MLSRVRVTGAPPAATSRLFTSANPLQEEGKRHKIRETSNMQGFQFGLFFLLTTHNSNNWGNPSHIVFPAKNKDHPSIIFQSHSQFKTKD